MHSARSVIEAIGTQFNVYRRHDDAGVSVLEGAVRISEEPKVLQRARQPVQLKAGEQVHIRENGAVMETVAADAGRVNAWRQRRLIFSNEPLSSIAEEFNRYNRTPKIRIEGDEVGDRRYAAAFDTDDPESLLGILGKDATLRVEQRADEIVIQAR